MKEPSCTFSRLVIGTCCLSYLTWEQVPNARASLQPCKQRLIRLKVSAFVDVPKRQSFLRVLYPVGEYLWFTPPSLEVGRCTRPAQSGQLISFRNATAFHERCYGSLAEVKCRTALELSLVVDGSAVNHESKAAQESCMRTPPSCFNAGVWSSHTCRLPDQFALIMTQMLLGC